MKQIRYYIDKKGKCPFLIWLKNLDKSTAARIDSRLVRLISNNYGEHKQINLNVSELKFQFGSGYRIYYTEENDTIIILLCAGNKKSQVKDIKQAQKYYEEYKRGE